MNKKPECVELQSHMVEYFSEPSVDVPAEIRDHLQSCKDCKAEFEQICQTLEMLEKDRAIFEEVPAHLLSEIESKIEDTPQLHGSVLKSSRQRNLMILQYSYLSAMAVIIWMSILMYQPLFNDWLLANELMTYLPVLLAEYGLFALFFAAGGIFAAISSPLIIKSTRISLHVPEKSGFFRRLFSGLRLFAC